jgi:hypothetical protein
MEGKMTEDEAKKKWCPFVAVANQMAFETRIKYERLSGGVRLENICAASDCMMWRCADSYFSTTTGTVRKPDTGYCGLGGNP